MYIRKISRKNADGSVVSYLQLAHNVRDPQKGYTKAEVIYNFGRQEELDLAAIKRLVKSLCRFLSPEDVLEATAALAGSGGDGRLRFLGSRAMGGAYLLRKLWERIGIEGVLSRAIANREFTSPVEWAVFAMVANRALAPDSKLGMVEWMEKDVALGNDAPIALQHLYRAMDVLLENDESTQKEVFFSTATLLNLEVDLLFFDTTSTYFERDEEDEEEGALLRYGKSKDKRDDLPQIVIGLAVTKEGIPVRCWVLPGNTADASTVEMVQKDLAGWKMSRCVWVMDRGMAGEENRRILQRAGGHYILGEKLRDKQEPNQAALSTPGRYRKIRENMEVKEIVVGDGERRRRFVLVFNPEEAKKDLATREKNLGKIRTALDAMGDPQMRGHKKAACGLLSHKTFGRYLREAGDGKIRAEERLDGALSMIRAGCLENPEVDAIFALHIMPEIDFGKINCPAGPVWAAADRFKIEITGRGGHGAGHFKCIDPVLVAHEVYSGLQSIERNLRGTDARVISVCEVHGGSAFNIIPDRVVMEGTVRTFDRRVQATIIRRMREIVGGICSAHGAKGKIDYEKGVPATINDKKMAALFNTAAREMQIPAGITIPSMGGEDFSYYLRQVQCLFHPVAFLLAQVRQQVFVHYIVYSLVTILFLRYSHLLSYEFLRILRSFYLELVKVEIYFLLFCVRSSYRLDNFTVRFHAKRPHQHDDGQFLQVGKRNCDYSALPLYVMSLHETG